MKKNLILSAVLLLSLTWSAQARYISEDEALSNAKKFISEKKLKSAHKGLLKLAHKDLQSEANYYVFSKGENAGFVIVSGSDKTDAVFGYVDNGNFDKSKLPSNVAYWLGEYSKQVEVAEAGNYSPAVKVSTSTKTVAPLLGATMWNQGAPYNDKCPVMPDGERCATGCVATAFAQVMYYYRWPDKGVGSHSYTSGANHFNLSADFSKSTYDWDLLDPYYTDASSAESNEAIAKLMSDVGISMDMDYGPESGAGSHIASGAMAKHFKYDERISCIYRDYFSRDKWITLMKAELDNARPIPYSGATKDGGHQFVLDGYDANDMFHVNWGWGGYCNGYFKINVLNPDGQGIGGFDGGYNSGQTATIGMMKPDASVELPHFCSMYADDFFMDAASVRQGNKVSFSYKQVWNLDFRRFRGDFNVGLYNENDELVASGGYNYTGYDLESFYGMGDGSLKTIFNNIPDGVYTLRLIVKPKGSSVWEKVNMKISSKKVTATVNGNTITFSNAAPTVDLTVSDIVVDECYQGFKTPVRYNLTNNGDEFDQPLRIVVCKQNDHTRAVLAGGAIVTPILHGETLAVETIEEFKLNPGTYDITVCTEDGTPLGDFVPFEVLAKTGTENLMISSFESEAEYYRDNFKFDVNIVNYGGAYQGNIMMFIYRGTKLPEDLNSEVTRIIKNNQFLKGDGTVTAVHFEQFPTFADGEYYAHPVYHASDGHLYIMDKGFTFKLVEGTSEVEVVETENNLFEVYPNPVGDVLNLSVTGNLEKVSIFNMNGALEKNATEATVDVSNLAAGNYIVIAEIDGKPCAKTFIKK